MLMLHCCPTLLWLSWDFHLHHLAAHMVFAEVLLICVVIYRVRLLQEVGLGILESGAMAQDERSLDPNNKYSNS
jgi:hypothetical protein